MYTEQKVILSADDFDRQGLLEFVKKIGSRFYALKIHSLFDESGPDIVKELKAIGVRKLWMDAKLHDIPNTVRLRASAFAKAGFDIITVHASGGVEMMKSAKEGFGSGKVYAVTALTSLNNEVIQQIYNIRNAQALVSRLAGMVKAAGVDGMVCAPQEITTLRANQNYQELEIVVPGIRSAGVDPNDQQRFDTPARVIKAGANYLVIGRQITKAPDPLQALDLLEIEIAQASKTYDV